ncbi:FAD-linked oxidoreductase domain protein [Rhodococcus sp. MTM3W5.2]|nr:FAD-linked oxidoreductase domain protein [Rhodococcus sp. MTM3W5.2]
MNSSAFSSAEQFITEPSASTICSARTWVARPPKRAPVPWVPVEIAPAMDCTSMSPRFVIARPRDHNVGLSSFRRVPARTVTRAPDGSTGITDWIPVRLSRLICTPSVTATGVKECPAPTHLTCKPSAAARVISSLSSATLAGAARRVGRALAQPAQFCQKCDSIHS